MSEVELLARIEHRSGRCSARRHVTADDEHRYQQKPTFLIIRPSLPSLCTLIKMIYFARGQIPTVAFFCGLSFVDSSMQFRENNYFSKTPPKRFTFLMRHTF